MVKITILFLLLLKSHEVNAVVFRNIGGEIIQFTIPREIPTVWRVMSALAAEMQTLPHRIRLIHSGEMLEFAREERLPQDENAEITVIIKNLHKVRIEYVGRPHGDPCIELTLDATQNVGDIESERVRSAFHDAGFGDESVFGVFIRGEFRREATQCMIHARLTAQESPDTISE